MVTIDEWLKDKQALYDGAVELHLDADPQGGDAEPSSMLILANAKSYYLMRGGKPKDLRPIVDSRTTLPICLEIIRKQREALEFYGNNNSYRSKNGGHIENKNFKSGIGRDCGDKARLALSLDPSVIEKELLGDK